MLYEKYLRDTVENSRTYREILTHRRSCKKWPHGFCLDCFGGGVNVLLMKFYAKDNLHLIEKTEIKTYKQLQKEFDKKTKELQNNCKHKRLSKWRELCWAPGHSSGASIKTCLKCNKEIMKAYNANRCKKCGEITPYYISGQCDKCKSNESEHVYITKKENDIVKIEVIKNGI